LPEIGGDPSECQGGGGIKWQRVEIRLCQLEMSLPSSAFIAIIADRRTYGQLGKGDGADDRLVRQ